MATKQVGVDQDDVYLPDAPQRKNGNTNGNGDAVASMLSELGQLAARLGEVERRLADFEIRQERWRGEQYRAACQVTSALNKRF